MANSFNNTELLTQESLQDKAAKTRSLLVDLSSDSYGRVFTDNSFSLPSDVDFFQEGFDIDLQNEMRSAMRASFFLEAPFALKTGYYEAQKCFVLRATPLMKSNLGTEASDYLKNEAYFAKDLNRMDGDTIYFISDTLDDGNTPFVIGDTHYKSFKEMAKTNDALTFNIRVLGMNAPEITHFGHMPYLASMPPETVVLKESQVREDPKYIYQYRMETSTDRRIEFYQMDGNYYEVVDMDYRPECFKPEDYTITINGKKQACKFMKFLYVSESTIASEKAGMDTKDDAYELLEKAEDVRILVDHKTLNKSSNAYKSPYDLDYNSIDAGYFEKAWNYIVKPWQQFFGESNRYARLGYNLPGMDAHKRYLGAIYAKIKVSDLTSIAGISAKDLGLPSVGFNEKTDVYTNRNGMLEDDTYDSKTGTVWVNLAKLLIYKYQKDVVALPDYSSDPSKEYFSGFVSSAFKLWTYDLKNFVNLDEFVSYTDEFLVERNQFFKNAFGLNYENLLQHHGIIGDTILSIPPTSITCITETQHQKAPLLRSRGPAVKSSTQSSKVIQLDLFFNEEDGINGQPIETTLPNGQKITYWMNGLRSLLAQFHLTPFLPIENEHINKVLNVEAVTLESFQISTVEGFPRTLQAKLVLREFNYRVYMPEIPLPDYEDENSWKINAFARTIHYPLLRWYYQRLLRLGNELQNYNAISSEYISRAMTSGAPPLVPMKFEQPYIKFYLPNKDFLDQRKQLAMAKAQSPIRTGIELTDNMKDHLRQIGQLAVNLQEALASEAYNSCIKYLATSYTAPLKESANVYAPVGEGQMPQKASSLTAMLTVCHNQETFNGSPVSFLKSCALSRRFLIMESGSNKKPFNGASVVKELEVYDEEYATRKNGGSLFKNPEAVESYLKTVDNKGLEIYQIIEQHCGNAGPVKVIEKIELTGEKDENKFQTGYLIQEIYLPLTMLPDIAEKEELDKFLATKTGVNTNKVFVSIGDGQYAIKLVFKTELKKVYVNAMRSSAIQAFVPASAEIFKQDTSTDAYAILEYCKSYLKDEDIETVGQDYISELDEYNKYGGALSVPFVEYDIPDILVTRCSAIYQNSLSEMILKSEDGGAHQYCGGQEINIEVDIMTRSEEALILLNTLPRLSASYVRDYREILSSWPLRIDSEITKFFGVNEVLIENVQIETVGGAPGLHKVLLRFTAVDRATRTREALKNIGVNNMNNDSLSDEGQTAMNNYFDLKRVLGQAELYPDLCLPTLDELSYNGFRFNRYTNGCESYRKYVDPDFYFVYGFNFTSEIFRQAILNGVNELAPSMRISDQYGAGIFMTPGDEKLGQPYQMNLNDIAKQTSNYTKDITTQVSYEDFKREMIFTEDYNTRRQLVGFETIADLGTEFWDLTDTIRLPFREDRFVNEVTQEDDKYRQSLIDMANKRIALIDDILNRPIDAKQVDGYSPLLSTGNLQSIDWQKLFSWIPGLGFLQRYDAILNNEKNARKWAEEQILECTKGYLNEYMLKEIFGIYDRGFDISEDVIYNMLLAAADSATGQVFQSNILSFKLVDTLTSVSDYSDYQKNWKLRPFLDLDIHNGSQIQTYCRISNPMAPDQQFAKTLEEAMTFGTGFGCFQVSKFNKEVVTQLCNPDELEDIAKSNLSNGYFLDDYYRRLQIESPKSSELEEYIGHMLYNPGYCAIAYIRNMLVWIRKMLKEEIILSMYEIIRNEAFGNWHYYDENEDSLFTGDMKIGDDAYSYYLDVLMALLNEGTAFNEIRTSKEYDDNTRNDALLNLLYELGISQDVHETIFNYKWKKVRKVSDITTELNKITSASEASEQRMAAYFKSIINKCLGLQEDGHPLPNEADPTVLGYFSSTFELYRIQRENEKAASLEAVSVLTSEICNQKYSHYKGWIVAASLLTMSGFGPVYDYFKERQIDTLDTLFSNIVMPAQNADYTKMKKYVLALEGRKVIAVSSIGTKVYSPEELMHRAIQESIVIQRSNNVLAYLKDSYLDMIQNDKRGRMVRAFPCYYMLFVDEGRKIGVWRLHDNFYNMNAITEINITKSRKIAADTAQIGMTNILKTFTTEEEEEQLIDQGTAAVKYDMRDAFNSLFSPRVYALHEELKRMQQTQPAKAALKPGIRIHVRLGYGADASTLPTVFNGTIAEVTNGEIVTIVAQGDGIELCNPLIDVSSSDEAEHQGEFFIGKMFSTWLSKGATPREILVSLMTVKGSWLQNKIRKMTDGRFFNSNPYGIVHFGDVDYKDIFTNGEVGQNIFEAAPGACWDHDNVSRMAQEYNTGDIPRISINTHGKTFWDMMHICASTQPNYITSVVPFGLRSSVFFGAGNYYYAYDYEERCINDSPIIMEKRKPFQQQHIYTSYSDIIHNSIKASAKNIKTVATGIYKENGMLSENSKQVGPLYADYDIYPEFQKSMTVDTQYYAKGYPFIGTGFGFATNYSKSVGGGAIKLPGAKEIAWRMTASALKNSMKDMYDGEIAVIGDPCVKPYDKMTIYDTYENMAGTCEVEAVVHSFNAMTGFTTSIYADCIAAVDDKFLQYQHGLNLQVAGLATSAQFAAIGAQKGFYHIRRLFDGKAGLLSKLSFSERALKQTLLTEAAGNMLGVMSINEKEKAGKLINAVDVFRQGWYKGNGVTLNFAANYGNVIDIIDAFDDLEGLRLADDVFAGTAKLLNSHALAGSKGVNTALKQDYVKLYEVAEQNLKSGRITQKEFNAIKETITKVDDAQHLIMESTIINIKKDEDLLKALNTLTDVLRTNGATTHADDVAKGIETLVKTKELIAAPEDYRLVGEAIDIARRLDRAEDVADATASIGKVLMRNADNVKDSAKVMRDISKLDDVLDLFKLAKLSSVPGIIWFILENVAFEVLTASAVEWVYRYLQNLEVLQIYPMKRKGTVMTAGLSGHKGSVVGSTTYNDQGEWTKLIAKLFTKKNDKTFLNTVLNILTPESLQYAADKLLEGKGYPVPEEAYTQEEQKEALINSFIANSTSIYTKRYSNNTKELAILNALRIKDLTSKEASLALQDYVNHLDYPDYSVASKDLETNCRPITSNVRINEFIKSGFLQLLHNEASMDTRVQSMTFNGEVISVPYYIKDNQYNVAVLREDAMLILEDLLYVTQNMIKETRTQKEKNLPVRNEILLTSATFMNEPEKSWENTGMCFRVIMPHVDIAEAAERLEQYYIKNRGAVNFLVFASVDDDVQEGACEYLFMAKPLMNRSMDNE